MSMRQGTGKINLATIWINVINYKRGYPCRIAPFVICLYQILLISLRGFKIVFVKYII
jgi:hypothetical protein